MGNSAVVFALVAVALFLLGLGVGFLLIRSSVKSRLEEAVVGERNLAEAREAPAAENNSKPRPMKSQRSG